MYTCVDTNFFSKIYHLFLVQLVYLVTFGFLSIWWYSSAAYFIIVSNPNIRHERDWRQSQSRSGEISKISRHQFASIRLKVPFKSVHFSGKTLFWTRRYDTLTVRKIWLFWAERGTGKYRAKNGNVPFEFVHGKNSVPLPSKAKKNLKRNFQFSG